MPVAIRIMKENDEDGGFAIHVIGQAGIVSSISAIKRMGDEKYRERERATTDVVAFGAAALGPLKTAIATEPDAEIVYRSEEARRKIETVSQASVAISAAKQLAKLKPADAVPTLLAFLPAADNETVAQIDGRRNIWQVTRESPRWAANP